jgi:hypothetical protein
MDTIVLSALIVLVLILLYLALEGAFSGVTNFNYNSDLNVRQDSIEVSAIKNPTSGSFAYGMWLMLNNGSDSKIFERKSELQIMLSGGALKLKVNNTIINVINNYPLQKWVYLVTTVAYNEKMNVSIVDVYMNGKMVKSTQISPPISPSSSKTSRITFGALNAKMIDFKRWTYALTPQMVLDEYEKSNMKKSLGSYSADVSIFKNNIMAKRFSFF